MENQDWRPRLQEAISKSGRSARDISLSIGRAPGYVHSLLKDEKEPTLPNVVAICDDLQISVQWLLFGVEMDGDAEELLKMYSGLPDTGRDEFMKMLRSLSALNR